MFALLLMVLISCSNQTPLDKEISKWCEQQNDGSFLKVDYTHFNEDQEELFRLAGEWPEHWGTLHITYNAYTQDDSIRFTAIEQDSVLNYAKKARLELIKMMNKFNPPTKYLSFMTDVARYYPDFKHQTVFVIYKDGTHKPL